MLQEIKDVNKLKEITKEAVLKYTDKIEENRQLRARVAELEALLQQHQTYQTKQGDKSALAAVEGK